MRAVLLAGGTMAFAGVSGVLAQDAASDTDVQPFDWSVALRGQYKLDSGGGHLETILAPDASITFGAARGQTTLSTGATIAYDGALVHPDQLRLGAASRYDLDPVTTAEGTLDLTLERLRPDDPNLPANTAIGPLEFTGTADGSVTRKFGQFDVTGRLTGERFMAGPTTLNDASTIDNSHQSYWLGAAGLRVGYEVTPLVSVFVDGSETYQKFDAPSPTLLTFLDGRTTELRAGISYTQDSIVSAEASIGRAWLDYFDPGLTDAPTWVYEASLAVSPNATVNLTGTLETSLGPSATVAGDTDVDYTLTGAARYQVNPWLTLRSSASWDRTITLGTAGISSGYSFGAGLDWASSRHAVWSADYLFAHDDAPPAPATDTHTVTVGLTIKR
ncbi:MAG: outer membrane beta-barrel protein [Devosia nanyangense]|uniref:Outer membrane beta-barrel protein n=1 Tax=Devosia nanyangense TaxID=1228055 RepID=A0A933NXR1_9HYPH|nr:outer membrane beta-barrel protein [Devosia nanyangense]